MSTNDQPVPNVHEQDTRTPKRWSDGNKWTQSGEVWEPAPTNDESEKK